MGRKQNKLLIIGGVPYNERPASFGGTTVLMQNFLEYCQKVGIPYDFVSTNRYGGRMSAIRNLMQVFCGLLRYVWRCDCIMYNASSLTGPYLIYPIIFIIGKMLGKKMVFRKFAGGFKNHLEQHCQVQKVVLFLLRHTNLSFFETRELVAFFKGKGVESVWFPNVRNRRVVPKTEKEMAEYSRRFVFMAHVRKTKGVGELIDCFRHLSDDFQVDIYGRLDDFTEEELRGSNYRYKGLLNPQEVVDVLKKYDVLLLPSYMEGYPGIVIEAYSVGVPVVATNVGGVPEILEEGVTGFMIESKRVSALENAIKNIDEKNHLEMSKNALAFFDNFDAEIVNKRILDQRMAL